MKWKNIKGYEGKYMISNTGIIKNHFNKEVGQWQNDQGYMLARLSNPRKTLRVHRLVAEAFIKNPNKHPFVNHINFVRHDNTFDNLEWCTQWQNLNHSRKSGRMQNSYWLGKRSPNAKIKDEDIASIKKEYSVGNISWQKLGEKYGVSKRTIGRILNGESYV